MTTRNLQTRLLFSGGWATDFGPSAPVAVEPGNIVRIPYLVNAENVMFDLDGGPRKTEGTAKLNATALESGATIRGGFDFWVLGTGASATQHRIVHVNDELMKDDADGSFTSIRPSARQTDSVPSYAQFEDLAIIMSDEDEAPLKWTGGGNAATLGTNTPKFAFGATHKNRFFAAGVRTAKSRLYYSEPLTVAGGGGADGDWNGVEAGFIDIDPDDGDEIRGLMSHKNELWVFKGPYTGSIHRIVGDTPISGVTVFGASTAPTPFSRQLFVRGLGAAGHNSIFRFRDDLGFIDGRTGSIHSLNATAAFGDFREAALSQPINGYLRTRVNKSVLKGAWSVSNTSRECVLITLAIDANTDNNLMLCMDHRFDPVRWSQITAVDAKCLFMSIDQTADDRAIPFIGATDGFVRKMEQANRSIDSESAINFKATTPFIDFGNPVAFKTFERGSVGIQPKGDYTGTFGWTRDDNAQQTTTFDQGGGDVLAGAVSSGAIGGISDAGSGVVNVVSVNHGLSTGDRIAINGMTGSITAAADGGGGTVTLTSTAHQLLAGQAVTISGTTDYNGANTITSATSNEFTITDTFTSDQTGSWVMNAYVGEYTITKLTASVFTVVATFTIGRRGQWQTSSTANFFVLGSSALAGANFVDRFFTLEEGGEFRSMQLELTQTGMNQDIEVHGLFVELAIGADSGENA